MFCLHFVFVRHVWVWCPLRPKEGTECRGSEVEDDCRGKDGNWPWLFTRAVSTLSVAKPSLQGPASLLHFLKAFFSKHIHTHTHSSSHTQNSKGFHSLCKNVISLKGILVLPFKDVAQQGDSQSKKGRADCS